MRSWWRKLGSEYRILGAFFLTLLVGISALNVAAIALYKRELAERLREQVELHLELFRKGTKSFPPYIFLSEKPLKGPDLILYDPSFDGKFVFIDLGFFKGKLRDFSLILFLWETALVLGLSYILYRWLGRYLKEKERTREFLEILLLALSHRLGNILAAQRVNIAILRERDDQEVLGRLELSYKLIEGQLRKTMELVRLLPKGQKEEVVDLVEVVRKTLEPLGDHLKGKEVRMTLNPVKVKVPTMELEVVVQLFMENAVKYSGRLLQITATKTKRDWELIVENDIASEVPSGSGLGLEIARRLARRFGGTIEAGEKNGRFRQVLRVSRGFCDGF